MKQSNIKQLAISLFLNLILFSIFPVKAFTADEYVFERIWPVLEQPWYFSLPADIAIDGQGNVYVADYMNHGIQKFSSSGAFISQWGDLGNGDGKFWSAKDIAIDAQGNLYVADSWTLEVK